MKPSVNHASVDRLLKLKVIKQLNVYYYYYCYLIQLNLTIYIYDSHFSIIIISAYFFVLLRTFFLCSVYA